MTTKTTFPTYRSPSLDVDMPDGGYSIKSYRKTEGREGVGCIANLVFEGKVIGEIADYGDGGGIDVRDMSTENTARFEEWCKQVPALIDASLRQRYPEMYADRDVPDGTGVEEAVSVFVSEFELLKDLKRLSKKKTLILIGDDDPMDGFREWAMAYDPRMDDMLKAKFPGERCRIWKPTEGCWVTV